MSEQDGKQAVALQRPATNDPEAWRAYWKVQGQQWRTEPEIDAERQKYLAERRGIVSDLEQGIYPFKEVRLSRADIEWLLATHENGQGPVTWSDESQRGRKGLDLRGSNLCQVDLSELPLTAMRGGLTWHEWLTASEEQRHQVPILMEKADLRRAHLEGANLGWAQLNGSYFNKAQLQHAYLSGAQLEHAYLNSTNLKSTDLSWAHLEGANLYKASLQGADLFGVYLENTDLTGATWNDERGIGPRLVDAHWSDTNLAVVNWSEMDMLADEYSARQKTLHGLAKDQASRQWEYKAAVRANRQLAVVLRDQGLNEEADYFAYRAQVLQRKVFGFQMSGQQVKFSQRVQSLGKWLFSWFLNLFTGYGFKPGRWLIIYLGIIVVFGVLHYFVGMPHPTMLTAIGTSVLNLHGRPFLNPPSGAEGSIDIVEAFVGLVVEAVLVAIITQRILGR